MLREAYLQCGGDWKKSEFSLNLAKTDTSRKHGIRRLFTRKQLVEKYGEKEADEIIRTEREDPNLAHQIQKNPDAPDNRAPR